MSEQEPIKEAYIREALASYLKEPFTITSIEEVDGEYIRNHQSDPQEIPEDTYNWIERVWFVHLRLVSGWYVDENAADAYYVAIPVEHPVILESLL